ncbi:hypothetical protein C4F40_13910 [Sphingobacterium sp. Ka21]|uniref:DUF4983 domain-containing protein n=2 Tax=Sphingobacterium pedocola TaxID=2082722 RepID=A0ABR9T8Y8_9SPHI|nr:hypothetical protein [Sphingobacterium pedocola]
MKMEKLQRNIKLLLIAFATFGLLGQCKEEFSKKIPPQDEEEDVDVVYGARKVLLLIVDGARGQSVRDAKSPTLTKLLPSSIHTWVGLSEENAQGIAANWTDIFTGVNYLKHGVVDNNFSTNKLDIYPSIFSRITDFDAEAKIEIISPNQQFLDNYGTDAEVKLASGDDDVKNKVIASLGVEDRSLITAHFEDIQKAGINSGFDLSYNAYREAINSFDSKVDEILKALEQREHYAREDWLVVITSSQGGHFDIPAGENDNTVFSNPSLNTFTVLYSPKYSSKFIGKPYIGNKLSGEFMRFNDVKYAELQAQNDLFDLGLTDFTIEIKIKKNRGSNNNYRFSHPSIIGKRETWQGGWDRELMNGWVIHLSDNFWVFNARGNTGYGEVKADQNQRLNDATWNTITVVGLRRETSRFVRLYTNGQFNREADITGWGNLNSNSPLRIGFLPTRESWRSDAYLADVKIWNTAMPEDMVQQFSCDIGVDPNHPYYANLVGYWPIMGGSVDGMLLDEGPFEANLKLGDPNYPSTQLNDFICAPSATELGQMVPRTYDVSAQIISWLKIPRQLNWQMDGRVWLDK